MHYFKVRRSGKQTLPNGVGITAAFVVILAVLGAGCSGSDGDMGPMGLVGSPGPVGPSGADGTEGPAGQPGANGVNASSISVGAFSQFVNYGATTRIEAAVSGESSDAVDFNIVNANTGASLTDVAPTSVTFVAPVSPVTREDVQVIVRISSKVKPSLFTDITIVMPGRGGVAGTIQ